MADNDKTAAEIAAGLDLTGPNTPADIASPEDLDAASTQNEIAAIKAANENAKITAGRQFGNIVNETLTWTLFNNALAPQFEADPNFTSDRFAERFKQAQEILPEDYWSDLELSLIHI